MIACALGVECTKMQGYTISSLDTFQKNYCECHYGFGGQHVIDEKFIAI